MGAGLGLENPTDPDAGTNRTNAVSSDNLMNEAGLKYSGNYIINDTLNNVGVAGTWWSSTIVNTRYSYNLRINNHVDVLRPQSDNDDSHIGRAVRCISPTPLVALVQDLIHCRMYILATITGVRVGFTTSRWLAATGRLV